MVVIEAGPWLELPLSGVLEYSCAGVDLRMMWPLILDTIADSSGPKLFWNFGGPSTAAVFLSSRLCRLTKQARLVSPVAPRKTPIRLWMTEVLHGLVCLACAMLP